MKKIIWFLFCTCDHPPPNDPNHVNNDMNDNCYNYQNSDYDTSNIAL